MKELREYTTTAKDKKRGHSRIPPKSARMRIEDLFGLKCSGFEMSINPKDPGLEEVEEEEDEESLALRPDGKTPALLDNYAEIMEERQQQNEETKEPAAFDARESDILNPDSQSQALFSRLGDNETTLQHFEIKKVLGKGTFGKVYLIERRRDKQLYAMKSIRKDIVINNEQIENARLEKTILMSVSRALRPAPGGAPLSRQPRLRVSERVSHLLPDAVRAGRRALQAPVRREALL